MMYATNLKTNYLKNPMGIDPGRVVFTWVPEEGVAQRAFRLVITQGNKSVFDSGIQWTSATEFAPDVDFPSRNRYVWQVFLWDEKGLPGTASRSFFETGIAPEDWSAQWIDPEPADYIPAPDNQSLNRASYLRKVFCVTKGAAARLYITAHGVYDAWINGVHVDGYFMAPGSSQYPKRLQVQTCDITELLREGENELLVTLGDGWWRGCYGWNMTRNRYGDRLALLCQVEIDGKTAVISDGSWQASQNGPLGQNDMMRLEQYDARKEISDWHGVIPVQFGYENLVGTELPIAPRERFAAKLLDMPNGDVVLDFGQNFAGYVELDLQANGGEVIRLTHGEVLDQEGNFQTLNFQNREVPYCDQKVEYICKPGRNRFHQSKCYYGFRYVKVETELPITGAEFTGVAVYSDMEQTGFFRCGNADVNQLFSNCLWSMRSNFVDIPTDCPHREKAGFAGDCQAFSGAALYLMDCYPVLGRWLKEQAATQREDGCVSQIAPTHAKNGKDGSAGWCDSFEIIPHRIMRRLNSTWLLKQLYPQIKKWMQFCIDRAKLCREENAHMPQQYRDWYVDSGNHWGEWCEPGRGPQDYFKEQRETGHPELATAFLSYGCRLTADMAQRLGLSQDAAYFRDAAEKARAAYRYAFVKDGRIESGRQCHFVRPIAHGLLTPEEETQAVEDLVALIRQNGNTIGTGFLTTYLICDVLTEHGYACVAYDLLLQSRQPSWLFEVQSGATTIWESWFGIRENGRRGGSHNHYSFGAVSGWLMGSVAGIRPEDGEISIAPHPDRRLGFAEATYLSPVGKIVSGWKYEGDEIRFHVRIPANSNAKWILPDGLCKTLSPGEHTYVMRERDQKGEN